MIKFCLLPVQEIEHGRDTLAEDWYIAMEALCEVLPSLQPLIVYFRDSSQWLSRAVPKSNCKEFVHKVEEMFDQLSGPVMLICGQNKVETGSKEKEKFVSFNIFQEGLVYSKCHLYRFTMVLPNLGRLAKLPLPLKQLTEGLKATKRSQDNEIYKLFTNVLCIHPPKVNKYLEKNTGKYLGLNLFL
ncbi:hypothetical protein HHK36_004119 [Tetracentron sinense]|uniref:Uncharacterized protein n=1 Tax=Tetracentron sinense TaxID=13715 RepID=A0A834ZPZ4_TETSI|nr:hypothetical protein HHK36_004119 [Tetracentron sinense]